MLTSEREREPDRDRETERERERELVWDLAIRISAIRNDKIFINLIMTITCTSPHPAYRLF